MTLYLAIATLFLVTVTLYLSDISQYTVNSHFKPYFIITCFIFLF